jgi:hypothetical protein
MRAIAKRCVSLGLALCVSSVALAGKKKTESDPIMYARRHSAGSDAV